VTLKLLDASAASAAARQVVRAGPALHDGLTAEAGLKDARLRALAAAQDGSMVSERPGRGSTVSAGAAGLLVALSLRTASWLASMTCDVICMPACCPCCWPQVEASIQEALSGLAQGLTSLEQQLSEAGTSEAQLNARLEKWTGGHACPVWSVQCSHCKSKGRTRLVVAQVAQ
jgi:hypothetical protein